MNAQCYEKKSVKSTISASELHARTDVAFLRGARPDHKYDSLLEHIRDRGKLHEFGKALIDLVPAKRRATPESLALAILEITPKQVATAAEKVLF